MSLRKIGEGSTSSAGSWFQVAEGTQQYSPFRSWDFDACVFITFDAYTYDVIQALEVLTDGIRQWRRRPTRRGNRGAGSHEDPIH
jgi:hypothetical protein